MWICGPFLSKWLLEPIWTNWMISKDFRMNSFTVLKIIKCLIYSVLLKTSRSWRSESAFYLQVIDLISLKPFDMETITKSVKKTRRVLIVEECMKTGGIGASLSAQINESLFNDLDHQVKSCQILWFKCSWFGLVKDYQDTILLPCWCLVSP